MNIELKQEKLTVFKDVITIMNDGLNNDRKLTSEILRELRFNLTGGKVKNIKEIHQTKKDIARALTLLNEKSKEKK